jgi:hypothetical protein
MVEVAYMKSIRKGDKEAYNVLNKALSANGVEDEDVKGVLTTLNKMRMKWLEKHFEEACQDCNFEMQEAILSLENASNRKILEQMRTTILENLQRKYNKTKADKPQLKIITSNLTMIKTSKQEKDKADLIKQMMEQDLQKKKNNKEKANTMKNKSKEEQKGKDLNKSAIGDLKQKKAVQEVKLLEEMQKQLDSKNSKIRTK